MAKFILLLHEDPNGLGEISPEEMQQIIEKYKTWRNQLAGDGKLVGGEKLADEGGRSLSQSDSGLRVVDGPYAEAKEVIGGFFMIEAADYSEAVEISQSCPHLAFGRIELRQIEEMQEG